MINDLSWVRYEVSGLPYVPGRAPPQMGCRMLMTLASLLLMSSFSASTTPFCLTTSCNSWYGFWAVSSSMRFSNCSICPFVRSLIALCASRSFALFLANCSGFRFATPLDPVCPVTFLFLWGVAVVVVVVGEERDGAGEPAATRVA